MSGVRDPRETDRQPADDGGPCKNCSEGRYERRRYEFASEGTGPRTSVIDSCPACGDERKFDVGRTIIR